MNRILAWIFCGMLPLLLHAQEKKSIRLKTPIHVVKYSDVQATTKMNVLGQDYTYAIIANIQTDYDFLSKQNNGYDVATMLSAINTQLSSDGVTMSFNSLKDTMNVDTIFAKPLSDILGKEDRMRIDSFGLIISSDTSAVHRRANEYLTSTLLLGNDYASGHRLDILFNISDSVAVGMTWTDSSVIADGKRVDTFTVEKVYNNIVYISSKGMVRRNLQVKQGGQTISALFEGMTSGNMQVGLKTGFVNSRTMKLQMNSHIRIGEQSIPISSEVELKEHIQ